jgi:predicted phosphodiesterase
VKPRLALVLGDIHIPFEDKKAIAEVRKVIQRVRPHTVVQVGDLLDVYGLSRFAKDPSKGLSLKQEAQLGRDLVSELMDSCEFFLFTAGNHENRLVKRLQDESDLASTHPTMRELLGIPEKNYVPYNTHQFIGRVAFTHEVGFSGVHSAHATLNAMQGSVVYGHSHRMSIMYGGDIRGGRHFALNTGWLGNPDACDYLQEARKKDWCQGLSVVEFSRSGLAHASAHPFINGKFLGV